MHGKRGRDAVEAGPLRLVLLGGAGLMGRATARDLLETRPDVSLVLADLDVAAAERIAGGLHDAVSGAAPRLSVARVDASDPASVRAVIAGADAVINSVQYDFNLVVMEAALGERVPYVDLGGLFHMTRRQLELGDAFTAAGVTAVIGMGSTPGVTNVQARAAADRLETVSSISVWCGNTPNPDALSAWGYSINTILDEVTKRPVVFRDGAFVELEPLAEPEPFRYLEPIGVQESHHSLHSEIATLPRSFTAKGVRDVSFKLNHFGYTPRALRQLKALCDAGLASIDPVAVPARDATDARTAVSVRPRDVLIASLTRDGERLAAEARARGEDPDAFVVDHEEVCVVVDGTREGGAARVRIDTMARGREDWRLAGGTLLTATPPGIVACWLADGSLVAPGVHPPETVIDPARLFAELDARGMPTTVDDPDARPGT